jgi:formimidoylglutamate deiminase
MPRRHWRVAGGQFGIGTDGHIGVAPPDEPRQLGTGQRPTPQAHAVAADAAQPCPGRALLEAAPAGGAQARGRRLGAIAPGQYVARLEIGEAFAQTIRRLGA